MVVDATIFSSLACQVHPSADTHTRPFRESRHYHSFPASVVLPVPPSGRKGRPPGHVPSEVSWTPMSTQNVLLPIHDP